MAASSALSTPTGLTSLADSSAAVVAQKEFALKHINDKMTMTVLPVTIFVGLEAILGFFGNVLVIYVFLFHYKHCNFRYFVLCLAFTDLTSTLTTIPGEVITQVHWYNYQFPTICKVKSFFNMFTVCAEALALVVIAVDRYFKVCWPFGFQISPRFARYLIPVIYVIAAILAVPAAIYWGVHTETKLYMNMNITVSLCEIDQKYLGSESPNTYTLSNEGIIGTSLVIMFILYILVTRRLLHNRTKSNINSSAAPISSTTLSSSHQHTMSVVANTCEKTDGHSLGTANVPKSKLTPDSAYSSNASSSGIVHGLHNKGYISDEGLSSTDIDGAYSDTGGNTSRGVVRTKTKRTVRRGGVRSRVRRKTMIMVILTVAFIITTIQYLTLLSFITEDVLKDLTDGQKAVYFFFFRMYFINHVINPIIYGLLDPTFKQVLQGLRLGGMKGSSTGGMASSSNDVHK